MHPLFLLAACSLFSCNPTVRKPRRMDQPGRPRINVQCGERLSNLAVFADVYVNLPQSDRKFRKNLSRCTCSRSRIPCKSTDTIVPMTRALNLQSSSWGHILVKGVWHSLGG